MTSTAPLNMFSASNIQAFLKYKWERKDGMERWKVSSIPEKPISTYPLWLCKAGPHTLRDVDPCIPEMRLQCMN